MELITESNVILRGMEPKWIQCHIGWNHMEFYVIELKLSELSVILKETNWVQCSWQEPNFQCYGMKLMWINVIFKGMQVICYWKEH